MVKKTFKELEQSGWRDKAAAYDDIFALITRQAISPLLDGLGDLTGKRLLDVACGTGHLAAEATQRGAYAEGTDFADTMLILRFMRVTPRTFFTKMQALMLLHAISACCTLKTRTQPSRKHIACCEVEDNLHLQPGVVQIKAATSCD
jgi:SAM-dependent methyltransferase